MKKRKAKKSAPAPEPAREPVQGGPCAALNWLRLVSAPAEERGLAIVVWTPAMSEMHARLERARQDKLQADLEAAARRVEAIRQKREQQKNTQP